MPNTLFFGARKQKAPFSLYRKEKQHGSRQVRANFKEDGGAESFSDDYH